MQAMLRLERVLSSLRSDGFLMHQMGQKGCLFDAESDSHGAPRKIFRTVRVVLSQLPSRANP
jgi:hypothetical protein